MAEPLKQDEKLIQETALVLTTEKSAGDELMAKLTNFVIDTQEKAEFIARSLTEAKDRGTRIEATRKRRVGPLNKYVDDTNAEYFALFKEGEKTPTSLYGRIILACKAKLLAWDQEVERKRAIEQAKLDEAARKKEESEKAKITKQAEKAEAKGQTELAEDLHEQAAAVSVPAPVVAAPVSNIGKRTNWCYEVTDFAALPDKYKLENAKMIQGVVTAEKNLCTIPGIRVFPKETPVTKRG